MIARLASLPRVMAPESPWRSELLTGGIDVFVRF